MMRTQADIDAEKAAYREAIAAVFRQKIEAAIKEAMDETGHTDAGLELADFVVWFQDGPDDEVREVRHHGHEVGQDAQG